NTKNKINNDYSTQINNINQAVSTQKAKNDAYNKAVAEANTLNSTADTTRKKLDDAIKAAQAVKGVTVIDGGTTTATVSVSDFEAKKKQIQDQNTQQANSINAQIQQYKKDLDSYNQKLSQAGKNVVDSRSVIQKLTIQSEPNAKVSITHARNVTITPYNDFSFNGVDKMGNGYIFKIINNAPASFDATWTGLSHLTYNGKRISKAIMYFKGDSYSHQNSHWGGVITNNIYYGFHQYQGSSTIHFEWFYEDGSKVNFENGTAYLAVASLNTYFQKTRWGYERTTVISGGKALALYGSSVSLHNENELYSDKANTLDTTGRDIAAGGYDSKLWQPWVDSMFSNQKDITNPNIPDKWDTADSPYRYYGAGLIALNGSDLTIKVDIKRDDAPKEVTHLWDNQWFNIGTVIPETPG